MWEGGWATGCVGAIVLGCHAHVSCLVQLEACHVVSCVQSATQHRPTGVCHGASYWCGSTHACPPAQTLTSAPHRAACRSPGAAYDPTEVVPAKKDHVLPVAPRVPLHPEGGRWGFEQPACACRWSWLLPCMHEPLACLRRCYALPVLMACTSLLRHGMLLKPKLSSHVPPALCMRCSAERRVVRTHGGHVQAVRQALQEERPLQPAQ